MQLLATGFYGLKQMFSNVRVFGAKPPRQQRGEEDGRLLKDLSLPGSAVPHSAEERAGGLLLLTSLRGAFQGKLGSSQLHGFCGLKY